jgi:hypothetical protein
MGALEEGAEKGDLCERKYLGVLGEIEFERDLSARKRILLVIVILSDLPYITTLIPSTRKHITPCRVGYLFWIVLLLCSCHRRIAPISPCISRR